MVAKKTTTAAAATAAKPVEKKAPAKKAPVKKTTTTKTVEVKTSLYVQFAGKEFTECELAEAAKKSYEALGNKVSDIQTLELYVKPEESAAYYAVNGVGSDEFKIEL